MPFQIQTFHPNIYLKVTFGFILTRIMGNTTINQEE